MISRKVVWLLITIFLILVGLFAWAQQLITGAHSQISDTIVPGTAYFSFLILTGVTAAGGLAFSTSTFFISKNEINRLTKVSLTITIIYSIVSLLFILPLSGVPLKLFNLFLSPQPASHFIWFICAAVITGFLAFWFLKQLESGKIPAELPFYNEDTPVDEFHRVTWRIKYTRYTFYAALALPLICSWSVSVHKTENAWYAFILFPDFLALSISSFGSALLLFMTFASFSYAEYGEEYSLVSKITSVSILLHILFMLCEIIIHSALSTGYSVSGIIYFLKKYALLYFILIIFPLLAALILLFTSKKQIGLITAISASIFQITNLLHLYFFMGLSPGKIPLPYPGMGLMNTPWPPEYSATHSDLILKTILNKICILPGLNEILVIGGFSGLVVLLMIIANNFIKKYYKELL